MDVLSNVFEVTNLSADVLGAREFVAPWGVLIEPMDRPVLHVVSRGGAWLGRPGSDPVRLNAGDMVLLSDGEAHALASDREMRNLEPFVVAIARAQNQVVMPREGKVDSATEPTVLHSAAYQFAKEGPHPLLSLLPPVIRIPAAQVAADNDLKLVVQLFTSEGARRDFGHQRVLPRLADALLVYTLRTWLREQPEGSYGWFGALRDRQIGKALSLIHERPQDPWTVEGLARSVAMSRAAFAKRFAELVSEPPLAYVTRWRMDLAAKMLRESREPVAKIARKVGYVSETAFAKAFRRRRKIAPGAYRYQRRQRGSGTGAPLPAQ
ncbi:MAG TPA: AraC family transcriptional regulator [Steroidobacteraceae bacterium]